MGKHILLLGATGSSGIQFSELALKKGHRLTLYVRNPSKIPKGIVDNPNVTVFEGEFSDTAQLTQAAESGPTILVSFAGPTGKPVRKPSVTPVADCYRSLFPVLIRLQYTRALILGTVSWSEAPEDRFSLKWSLAVAAIKTFQGSAYQEMNTIGKVVSSQPADQIGWTLFRVPFLGGQDISPVKEGFAGSGTDGLRLSRGSMTQWVLDEIDSGKWIGKAPTLAN